MMSERRPWSHQKDLLKEPIPNPNEIINLAITCLNERNKALFILGYLSGGRISELLEITKMHFQHKNVDGRDLILIKNLPNRKNKERHFKDIPIPIDNSFEKELFSMAWNYIDNLYPDRKIFDFTKIRAYQILKKDFDVNPHYLRHVRATHLVTEYNFNSSQLESFMGWSDARPAKHYVQLAWRNIIPPSD